MSRNYFLIFVLIIIFAKIAHASVGIGISPAKVVDIINGGTEKSYEYTVYNTGDMNVTAKLEASDELKKYVKFSPVEVDLQPEPEPHRLPPVNGKKIIMILMAPKRAVNITGSVVASVNPGFGGLITTGAVASRFILEVRPRDNYFNMLTRKQITGMTAVLVTLMLLAANIWYILKRKGIIKRNRFRNQ